MTRPTTPILRQPAKCHLIVKYEIHSIERMKHTRVCRVRVSRITVLRAASRIYFPLRRPTVPLRPVSTDFVCLPGIVGVDPGLRDPLVGFPRGGHEGLRGLPPEPLEQARPAFVMFLSPVLVRDSADRHEIAPYPPVGPGPEFDIPVTTGASEKYG